MYFGHQTDPYGKEIFSTVYIDHGKYPKMILKAKKILNNIRFRNTNDKSLYF